MKTDHEATLPVLGFSQAVSAAVFPARFVALNHESPPTSVAVLLSEFGSLQMELWALSQRIKTPELGDLATFSIRFIDETYEGKARRNARLLDA